MNKIQTTDVYFEQYKKQLRKNKDIKVTGSGAFSTVYKHALIPDQVLKVGVIHYGPDKDGYVEFIKACQKVNTASGKHNPFLPKVFDIQLFKHSQKAHKQRRKDEGVEKDWGYYVVTMERLKSISYNDAARLEANIRQVLDNLNERRSPLVNVLIVNEDFILVAKMLKRLFNKYDEDFHEGNFMVRGNQPVIIDPVVSCDMW